jgi:tetratricopeptide (TPR) repeat protein
MGILTSLRAVDQTAIRLVEESLAFFREVGDDFYTARALLWDGLFSRLRGDHKLASEYYQQSLALQRAIGDSADMPHTVAELGLVMFVKRNLDEAERYRRDAYLMAKAEQAWEASWIGIELGGVFALGKQGNIQEARSLVEEGSTTMSETIMPLVARLPQALALNALSLIECMNGDYAKARTLGEEASTLAAGDPWEPMY